MRLKALAAILSAAAIILLAVRQRSTTPPPRALVKSESKASEVARTRDAEARAADADHVAQEAKGDAERREELNQALRARAQAADAAASAAEAREQASNARARARRRPSAGRREREPRGRASPRSETRSEWPVAAAGDRRGEHRAGARLLTCCRGSTRMMSNGGEHGRKRAGQLHLHLCARAAEEVHLNRTAAENIELVLGFYNMSRLWDTGAAWPTYPMFGQVATWQPLVGLDFMMSKVAIGWYMRACCHPTTAMRAAGGTRQLHLDRARAAEEYSDTRASLQSVTTRRWRIRRG